MAVTGGNRPRAVLGVGAGIAAYKVAVVASKLVQLGADVRVAMTPSSLAFVGPSTFGGLTNTQPILSPTQVDDDGTVPHIEAARAAIGPDIALTNDVNCNWTSEQTLAWANWEIPTAAWDELMALPRSGNDPEATRDYQPG